MRLERLIVHGFNSITHVDLDLTALPSGVLALWGPYGAGKTTLLEGPIAALLRGFPCRDGDLKDYATGKDSHLEARFVVEGVGVYRAIVRVDSVTGKSDATLELNGMPVNDGKVTTFDQAVRARFPSREILLAAAIASQNKRGNFIGKKPKEKADLFTELLGLMALLRMSDTAKQNAGATAATRLLVQTALDELARGLGDDSLPKLDAMLEHVIDQRGAIEATRQQLQATIDHGEARLELLRADDAAHAAATHRLATIKDRVALLQADLARSEREGASLPQACAAAVARARAKADADRQRAQATCDEAIRAIENARGDDVKTARTQRDAIVADNTKRIAGNQQIQRMATEIRAAVATLADLATKAETLRATIADRRQQEADALVAYRATERAINALRHPASQLVQAKTNAALLTRVPFGQQCAEAGCEFVTQAAAAQREIPALEQTVQPLEGLERTATDLNAAYQAHAAAVATLTREETDLLTERGRHEALAKHDAHLAEAEAKIAGYEASTRQAEQTYAERQAAIAAEALRAIETAQRTRLARVTEIDADLARIVTDLESARDAALETAAAQVVWLREALAKLAVEEVDIAAEIARTASGHQAAIEVQADVVVARRAWDDTTADLATNAADQRAMASQRAALVAAQARRTVLEAKRATLDADLVDWQQLQRALAELPRLEIDAAGPLLSQMTNEILTASFGPRFSGELVTQQAKADGGMKESFDLLVYDNERGGEQRRLSDLSGGEQIIMSEALMNALSLYTNLHAPLRLQTIWRDETVGSLDAAARVQYLQMLRKVQEIGGYHHVLIVTHDREIAEMCDAIITVDKATGTAAVATPPYQEAA